MTSKVGWPDFRALENIADESQRRAAELRIARLLFQELGRPLEAIEALLPLLGESSEASEAQEMLRLVLGDAALRPDAIDRLEQLAGAATGSRAARITSCSPGRWVRGTWSPSAEVAGSSG